VFGPLDYFVLQFYAEINKVITVSCNSYQEISVFFWIFLCITQGFSIYNVELNMMPVEFEIGANEMGQLV